MVIAYSRAGHDTYHQNSRPPLSAAQPVHPRLASPHRHPRLSRRYPAVLCDHAKSLGPDCPWGPHVRGRTEDHFKEESQGE